MSCEPEMSWCYFLSWIICCPRNVFHGRSFQEGHEGLTWPELDTTTPFGVGERSEVWSLYLCPGNVIMSRFWNHWPSSVPCEPQMSRCYFLSWIICCPRNVFHGHSFQERHIKGLTWRELDTTTPFGVGKISEVWRPPVSSLSWESFFKSLTIQCARKLYICAHDKMLIPCFNNTVDPISKLWETGS